MRQFVLRRGVADGEKRGLCRNTGNTGHKFFGGPTALNPPLWYLALLFGLLVPAIFSGNWFRGEGVSLWAPAYGLGFALLIIYGLRWWPMLVAADFGLTLIANTANRHHPMTTAEFLVTLALVYGAAAQLLRVVGVDLGLRRLRDALWLSGVGLIATVTAASASVAVVIIGKSVTWHQYWNATSKFASGAAAGTFAVAPLLMVSGSWLQAASDRRRERSPNSTSFRPVSRSRAIGLLAQLAEFLVQGAIFGVAAAWVVRETGSQPRYYPLLLPLFWIALRRGIAGTAIAAAAGTCVVTAVAHTNGLNPQQIVPLEIFLTVFGVTGLTFGSAQTERHDSQRDLEASRQALLESEHRLQMLIEGSTDYAIFMVDPVGRVLTWSAGAQHLNGYRPDEIIGRSVAMLQDPASSGEDQLRDELKTALSQGRFSGEDWRVRKDGSRYWASVTITPIRDHFGSLQGFSKVVQDLSERRAAEQHLTVLATHDPLTGLANRRYFLERLDDGIKRAADNGRPLGVIFIDLNGFKQINDQWGHATGDRVLAIIGERVQGTLRASDTAGRYGGDEFVVLCEDLPKSWELASIADRIAEAIEKPIRVDNDTFSITASVGLAQARPGVTPTELLHEADQEMFLAKQRQTQRYVRTSG